MSSNRQIILASKSPRRFDLLTQNNIEFQVVTQDTPELTSHPNIDDLVMINAERKATAVADSHAQAIVIGADTIVVYDNQVIGKPRDLEDAINILSKLVGNTHTVITGVAICCRELDKIEKFTVKSYVTFKALSRQEIIEYTKKIHVLDKAGAYAMQEHADLIVEKFEGSFDNIVGLPVKEVLDCLAKF